MTTSDKPILLSREELELLIEMAGFDDPAPLTGRPEKTLTAAVRPAVERGLLAKQALVPNGATVLQIERGLKNLLTLCYYPDRFLQIDFRFEPHGLSTRDSFFLFDPNENGEGESLRIHLYQQFAGVYRFDRLIDMPDLAGRVLATLQTEREPQTAPAELFCSIQTVTQGESIRTLSLMRKESTLWELDPAAAELKPLRQLGLEEVETRIRQLLGQLEPADL